MSMPKVVDPYAAFDFIHFQRFKYCENGIKPPTMLENVGGYEAVVKDIVAHREKQIQIGVELMDAAKLQIGQGLIDRDERELYDHFTRVTNLSSKNTKKNLGPAIAGYRLVMDTLLDKFNELNRHRDSMSNVVVDTLNEIYDVTPQWLSELNDMHNIYGPKLNVRFRCLNYLFPVDIKEKSKKLLLFLMIWLILVLILRRKFTIQTEMKYLLNRKCVLLRTKFKRMYQTILCQLPFPYSVLF